MTRIKRKKIVFRAKRKRDKKQKNIVQKSIWTTISKVKKSWFQRFIVKSSESYKSWFKLFISMSKNRTCSKIKNYVQKKLSSRKTDVAKTFVFVCSTKTTMYWWLEQILIWAYSCRVLWMSWYISNDNITINKKIIVWSRASTLKITKKF